MSTNFSDSKIVTTQLCNEAGIKSAPNILGKAKTYAEVLKLAQKAKLGSDLVVQTPYGDSGRTTVFINWSQLILIYPVDRVEMIIKAPASGIWQMNQGGDISLVRKSIDWFLVSGENEAFYLRVYTAGDYRYHGADMGILVSRGRMQTDDHKLKDRARDWITARRSLSTGTAAHGQC